jgi:hypothetical protein
LLSIGEDRHEGGEIRLGVGFGQIPKDSSFFQLRTSIEGAEIRPRVHVISHQFNRIAVDVVIKPSQAVEPPAAGSEWPG